ncbi:unnamed protein product [Closterium sp. NIES-65]|nr:unnamed protein product [Closterium sp. NIES-65]
MGILAFEVASTMLRALELWGQLEPAHMDHLRKVLQEDSAGEGGREEAFEAPETAAGTRTYGPPQEDSAVDPRIHQTAITPLPFPPPFLPPFLPPFPPSLSPSFPPLLFPPPFPPALPPLSFPFSFPPVRVQSDGVTKMIPGDEKRHWRLAGLEYLRELQVLSSLVCVLSRRCKDPRMHRLKQRLAELEAQGEAHLREREAQEGGERESGGSEGDAREGDAREGGIGRLQGQQGDGGAQGGGMAQGSGRGKEMMVVGRGWDGGGGWEGKGNVNVNVNGSGGGGGGGGGGDASEEDWFLYSPKEEAFLRKFLEKKVTATNRLHVEMTLLDNLMPSPLSPIFKPLPPIFNPLPPFFNPPSPPLSLPSSSHSLRMARFTKDAPSWATTAIAASPFVREKIHNLRSLLYPNPPLPPFPPLSPLPPSFPPSPLFPPFPPLSPLPPSFPPSPLFPPFPPLSPLPPSSPTSPPPTLLLFPLPCSFALLNFYSTFPRDHDSRLKLIRRLQKESLWVEDFDKCMMVRIGWCMVMYTWVIMECGCMDGWMDACVGGCMDGWVHGWMDACVGGCMDGWVHGWKSSRGDPSSYLRAFPSSSSHPSPPSLLAFFWNNAPWPPVYSSAAADQFLKRLLTILTPLLAAAVAILSYKVRSTFKWQRGGGSSGTGGAAAEDEREGVAGTVGEAGLSIRYAHTLQILERILNKPTLLLRAQR